MNVSVPLFDEGGHNSYCYFDEYNIIIVSLSMGLNVLQPNQQL